ncbi:efflux RND transporter periplasmic adaptor subunit [Isosphaeraceae bacterium EP7]
MPPPSRGWRGLLQFLFVLIAIGAAIGGLLAAGIFPRIRQEAELHAGSVEVATSLPRVRAVQPKRVTGTSEMILPGDVTAFSETSLFARTNGYLRRYLVDIGDNVKAGQLLAEIETPELDQELLVAKATVDQFDAERLLASAKEDLARVSRNRNLSLFNRNAATRQEVDDGDAALKVAEAAVKAADAAADAKRAAVNRLESLQSFQKILAPFDGVVTARNVNQGDLIDQNGATGGRELFKLVNVDTLRIFVYVPQLEAPEIHNGQEAQLLVREFPDRAFVGKVVRTAGAIDPASRTLLTEVQIDNGNKLLYAGMYVKVRFQLKRARQPLTVPATVLSVNADGTRVASVGNDGEIHYLKIELGRDMGQDVEVLSGLVGDESLILNPIESLSEGRKVEIIAAVSATAEPSPAKPAAPKVH